MRKKKVIARYAHLRKIIVRAKEDAERWTRKEPLLMLAGIKDQNAYDFEIYENSYAKFLKKKQRYLPRKTQPEQLTSSPAATNIETSYARIADALERIATQMEKNHDG